MKNRRNSSTRRSTTGAGRIPCSESQQAIAPPTALRALPTSVKPAASAVPAAPAAREAGAAPVTPKSPKAAQQGGSSSSTDEGTAYLMQVAASASAARVAAGAASVSAASAAASATRIEGNIEVSRETLSEVLQLTQRLYHYARPRDRNVANDMIRRRSSSRARYVLDGSRRERDVLDEGRGDRAHDARGRDERGHGRQCRPGGRSRSRGRG